MPKRGLFQFSVRWILLGAVIAAIVIWFVTRETLPREIRIATGYYSFGKRLQEHLAARTGRKVVLVPSQGSGENRELLRKGAVHLAILQAGAVSMRGLTVAAPLYPEPVYVIVRKGLEIASAKDLMGRHVALGPDGSGMRASAIKLLEHCGIGPESLPEDTSYFTELSSSSSLEAAIVTSGMLSPDLHELMRGGGFDLLPLVNARALSIQHPYFMPVTIPCGLFRPAPPIPAHPVETVATTAVLAVRADAPGVLVEAAL
ncbi:MAG: TAXI family TRAP transporter solute-binding subunit, partial [Planctomycetota bacterium]